MRGIILPVVMDTNDDHAACVTGGYCFIGHFSWMHHRVEQANPPYACYVQITSYSFFCAHDMLWFGISF